ncbi:hypothetical protein BDN70DRAFT_871206 [Pholiota conissans]|uniref:Uncharacterized protein n=1 Tax=Pholiota conissans TaxID=109636 RepID=A0A9P6D7C3_9AGAR|nr:hypothetical protein BDN70DRAFT_871206 [Pholiota conissans]
MSSQSGTEGFRTVSAADIGGMSEYMHLPDWEALIKAIVSVVKNQDGTEQVYFITTNNQVAKEDLSVCMQRFPSKMRAFVSQSLTAVQT